MAKGKQSIFDRLSGTDTYASRRLKEKKVTAGSGGRPLFNIVINDESRKAPALKSTGSSGSGNSRRSGFTQSTAGTSSTGSSSRSATSRAHSFASQASSGSVFDRLASHGTKSSMRKHKKSDTYDSVKDKRFQAEHYLRNFKGNTRPNVSKHDEYGESANGRVSSRSRRPMWK